MNENKIKAIEWLAGYMNPPASADEDSALLSNDLDISLEEAQTIVAECEVRLIEMFNTWKEVVSREVCDEVVDMSGEEQKPNFNAFSFDSQECAAVARDLALLQLAEGEREDLNFAVADLEIIMQVAKGDYTLQGGT